MREEPRRQQMGNEGRKKRTRKGEDRRGEKETEEGRWSHLGKDMAIFTLWGEAEQSQCPSERNHMPVSSPASKVSPISKIKIRYLTDEDSRKHNVLGPPK